MKAFLCQFRKEWGEGGGWKTLRIPRNSVYYLVFLGSIRGTPALRGDSYNGEGAEMRTI